MLRELAERPAGVTARSAVSWSLSYGLARGMFKRAARKGDVMARLELDPRLIDDPFPTYEDIRSRGRLVRGRVIPVTEIDRLRGDPGASSLSARNRFNGTVTDVTVEGLLARVELVVTDPVRLVAVVTRDAVEDLGLRAGMPATALVKSTSMMLQR